MENPPFPSGTTGGTVTTTDVLVIGSGFAGLGLAVRLQRDGVHDFLVLERAGDVGGTWRDNTYPGAACDIQSHLYSYSFRPNPYWSRVYATQPEILAYLRRTADEEGVRPRIRFGEEVLQARWDPDGHVWDVRTGRGRYRARALVSAAGHLSDPAYPDLPGLGSFAGEVFHSARWRHDVDLTGRRVGIVGTGASAVQIVPALQPRVQHLTVFQRSAPYVVPRRDRAYTEAEKGMFARFPETARSLRDELFWGNESRFPQRLGSPLFLQDVRRSALDHLAAQVGDEDLRRRLTPDYEIGCKRILISNDYYPAIAAEGTTLVTSGIDRVTPAGVVTGDGEPVELDALVVATGFEAADLPVASRISGRGGTLLSDHWRDGGRAYACTTVPGFPNLFVMLGPNTGLGAGSIVFMVETQISYIAGGLDVVLGEHVDVEPTVAAEAEFVADLHARSAGTVWTRGGCTSWYLHPRSGRLTTLWPDFMSQFRRDNGRFSREGYAVSAVPEGAAVGA
ncbi:flavin-containing monooxygenase [Kineococcus sp. SYSU DK001]|uniref:flavin-containing monooxygenase n=1 Tax=Kineococcus sp. SYSU DK001 TaxID=3383122 RepID=UPI003D7DF859